MTESTSPKPFVFVLMPFSSEFDDVYKLGIKSACYEASTYCERVDEQMFTESILDRIYNQISKADIVIADMSTRNPNVFYETGYAHALGKQVILLTQKADDIPFDMKHYPHIIYNSISYLKDELRKRVEWCIKNPRNLLPQSDFAPDYFVQGQKLELESNIILQASIVQSEEAPFVVFDFPIDLHNSSKRVYDLSRYQLTLVGDWETRLSFIESEINTQSNQQKILNDGYYLNKTIDLPSYNDNNIIALPNKNAMFIFPIADQKILPDGWYRFKARLAASIGTNIESKKSEQMKCTVKVYGELGTVKEIDFSLELNWK